MRKGGQTGELVMEIRRSFRAMAHRDRGGLHPP